MYDRILDWIEDHRKLTVFLVVVVVIVGLMFGIRAYNLNRKSDEIDTDLGTVEEQGGTDTTQDLLDADNTTENDTPESDTTEDSEAEEKYQSALLDKVDESKNNHTDLDNVKEEDKVVEVTPNIDVSVNIFSKSKVPDRNVDGSSCKAYLKSVDLLDFDPYWGTALDINDMKSTTKYLVGVEQDGVNSEIADLQSVGWLISNLNKLDKHDAIKFTNLHTIGSLSDDHVAILCSYDWYSVYGLKDTLVLFEDVSGNLDPKDFKAGSIFSATAFVHNIKVKKVNGQNVVCVQYNVFK